MRRVAVTGLGVVSPIGAGRQTFWDALLAGTCGIGPVTSFDTADLPVHLGAEIPDFEAARYFRRGSPDGMGRGSHLATAAARLAIDDAGISEAELAHEGTGVAMGTTSGEPGFVEQYNTLRQTAGADDPARRSVFARYPSHLIPDHVAWELGLSGPRFMIPNACAAGNFAIGYAFDLIRAGRAGAMLAGGADAFSRIPYVGFARLGAIAPECCQPFDRNRTGMVPGEGAGVLLIEDLERARARGARIYAEILGYGVSCDAHHMTAAHPQGDGAVRAMKQALHESGVGSEEVDYISAHGTGTPSNDRVESIAVKTLMGKRAPKVPMSSIKSMLGHTMGAASAIEAVACALALDSGWIPPTIHHREADPECGLDVVPNHARRTEPRIVLNNAYAFGGNNACLCLARWEEAAHA